MNLVILTLSNEKIESDNFKILHSNEKEIDRKLADLSIQLDEYIFLDHNDVDCVIVTEKELFPISDIALLDSDTVYFPSGFEFNFYCSPGLFSNLGNLYKINFNKIIKVNSEHDPPLSILSKLYFLIHRLGYKINVKD